MPDESGEPPQPPDRSEGQVTRTERVDEGVRKGAFVADVELPVDFQLPSFEPVVSPAPSEATAAPASNNPPAQPESSGDSGSSKNE